MGQILILEDEQPLLQSLSIELSRGGHDCLLAEDGRTALQLVKKHSPDLAVLDVQLPDMSGLEVLRALRTELPEVPVVIITAFASVDTAVEAMKEGANDYLEKPLDLEELQMVVDREINNARLRTELEAFRRDQNRSASGSSMIGQSPGIQRVRELVERLSSVPVENPGELPTVLIEGETGTGKDLLARHIHSLGPLADRPFVQVNCSGLPRELVESELFGHEKGSFTGATQHKQGLFEVAKGGTIFLDEIGDMAPEIQTKLLNVLEGKPARRVGATREYAVDVRIIAATNRGLEAAVQERSFRSDLYYRLKVVHVELPPLRERQGDVPLLVDYFLARYCGKYRKPLLEVPASLARRFADAPWPGNIRELAHTIEHLVLTSEGRTLSDQWAPGGSGVGSELPVVTEAGGFDFESEDCTLDAVERRLVQGCLGHTKGNVSEAARLLGISRGSLRHRMEKWALGT